MAGILDIGKSGLFAAQVGLETTGHNIANANVAGYSRQVVLQSAAKAHDMGNGFVGGGTEISEIKRFSDPFLNSQVRTAQASTSALNTYYSQISQIDNLLADTTSGVSPALQDFFQGVQDVSTYPNSSASRQSLLSTAESLASRFQGVNARLQEVREGVNSQIASNVTVINSYARQIAELNDQIGSSSNNPKHLPNDLLDARDQVIAELNKHVKTTVVAGDKNSVTVSIGTGQPLVVGKKAFEMVLTNSPTDAARFEVGYVYRNKLMVLDESTFSGGELGGLFEFRANTLDRAQNSLGRMAIGMAISFNAQHQLGVDQSGAPGAAFFKVGAAEITKNSNNNESTTAGVAAVVTDPTKLTQSDYLVSYDGTDYSVKRMPNGNPSVITPPAALSFEGIEFSITAGTIAAGDSFMVRPTINGAAQFAVLLSERGQIAASSPLLSEAGAQNTGSGKIGEAAYGTGYVAADQLAAPVALTFSKDGGGALQFSAPVPVTVTVGGVATDYAAGAAIPYAAASGASVDIGNAVTVALSGTPDVGDVFTISRTATGADDNRNMRALGALQTQGIFNGGNTTLQATYAELVSFVGNKTREVQVSGKASDALLVQARNAQQEVSGVNLDEEATNLIRYQQAYQAAGKVMQIASQMFDTLIALGR